MSPVKWKDVPTRTIGVEGVPFAYRDLGPDSDVPVVFLHHLVAVLDDWDPRVIDGIAAHRRVIAFDNRGVGASGGSVPHTIEEMARDAIAFIRALGLKKVDLFGSSRVPSLFTIDRSCRPASADMRLLLRRGYFSGRGRAGSASP
jgi:hypothetical protein